MEHAHKCSSQNKAETHSDKRGTILETVVREGSNRCREQNDLKSEPHGSLGQSSFLPILRAHITPSTTLHAHPDLRPKFPS